MGKSNQSPKTTSSNKSRASKKFKKLKQKFKQKKERKLRPRISSARHSRQYADIILSDLGEGKTLLIHDESSESWKKRWAALGLFCALNCTQCCVWNTWGPIAKSVMEAYPTWNKTSVALLCNWGCITYLTCCLPCCWFLNETDLAIPLKLAAILSTLATFIRCISARDMIFTTMAHLAAIFNGLAGVIIGPATALVSAVWFSSGERTTATGISSAFSQLGMAVSYILGPALVGDPPHHRRNKYNFNLVEVIDESSILPSEKILGSQNVTIHETLLRIQIMSLMRIEFVIQAMVLIGVLFCFPKQSQISNSNIQVSTLGLWESLIKLIKHKSMWYLSLAAALTQGMTGPWLGMITMAFGNAVTQEEADKLAFWTVIVSSVLSLFASRVTDMFQGHLKIAIGVLLITSSIMFLWIILLDCKILVFHKDELYAAVVLGIATNWSTPALFLELASEIAFPISEAIVGGYMIFLSNIVGTIFYLTYCIPGMEGRWSTCLVFSNIVVGAFFIFYVDEQYNRTKQENEIIPLVNREREDNMNE